MTVLIVMRWPVGGIRTYVQYVYKHKCLKQHKYIVVAPYVLESSYLDAVFVEGSYTFVKTDDSTKDLYRVIKKIISKNNIDLIHSHGTTAGFCSSLANIIRSTPHILTTHDVFFDKQYKGVTGYIKRALLQKSFKLPTVINPCGHDAANNFISFFPGINVNKIRPIRNGIDIKKFTTSIVRDLKNEVNKGGDIVLLGFYGRFMSQKGFDLLVGALEIIKKEGFTTNIHVACFGWGGFIREEQESIRNKSLESFFTFFEQTDDMSAALKGVDIAIMPSRWEACPLLPMESLVVGTPVIASDCVGMNEVCMNTPAKLFENGSVDSLVEVLLGSVSVLPSWKVECATFKKEAVIRFDSEITAKKLNALYLEVIDA